MEKVIDIFCNFAEKHPKLTPIISSVIASFITSVLVILSEI